MKYWGEPTDKTSGLTSGMEIARHNAPKIAPTNELIRAAPRARPASPFFAMGWPSTTMEAVMGSRDAEEDRSDVTSGGGNSRHPKEKRKRLHRGHCENKRKHQGQSDRPAEARQDSHQKPMAIPANWRTNAFQVKSWIRPWRKASRISTIAEFQRARGTAAAPQKVAGRRYFFSHPGYQKLCQFGLECRTELVKAGHQFCHSGAINWIDVHLGFFASCRRSGSRSVSMKAFWRSWRRSEEHRAARCKAARPEHRGHWRYRSARASSVLAYWLPEAHS